MAASARSLQVAVECGLVNVDLIAEAAEETRLLFHVACALIQKESGGRNVYGNDRGGALSGFPHEVTEGNFEVFRWLVLTKKQTSNGVGPCQITWRGFFVVMERKGLRPWDPLDNMRFGFDLLRSYHDAAGIWAKAGAKYNGAASYGRDLDRKIGEWKKRLDKETP